MSGGGRWAFTTAFESTGTHRVRAELYDEGTFTDEDATPIGTAGWVVDVASNGDRPPTVERIAPNGKTITASRDSPEKATFEVSPDRPGRRTRQGGLVAKPGEKVVSVSPVAGSSDPATLSFAPEVGCPFDARAIDERGALSALAWWNVEET